MLSRLLLSKAKAKSPVVEESVMSYELTEKQYSQWHVMRMARSSMPEVEKRAFNAFLQQLTTRRSGDRLPNFSTLSVGSGRGDLDLEWNQVLSRYVSQDRYDCLEPNSDHLSYLENNLKRMKELHPDLKGQVITSTMETYEGEQLYDLIHFVHCVHWFQNPVNSLKKALKMLRPGGILYIVVQSEKGIPQLYHHVQSLHPSGLGQLTAEDLSALLSESDLDHKLEYFDAQIDVRDCLAQNEHGFDVLSFLLNTQFRNLEDRKQIQIIDQLHRLTRTSGFFYEPVAHIILGI